MLQNLKNNNKYSFHFPYATPVIVAKAAQRRNLNITELPERSNFTRNISTRVKNIFRNSGTASPTDHRKLDVIAPINEPTPLVSSLAKAGINSRALRICIDHRSLNNTLNKKLVGQKKRGT